MVTVTAVTRPWQRRSPRQGGLWAAVLGVPLALNLLIWWGIVRPQRERWMAWRDMQAFVELRPGLETLLQDSRDVLAAWRQTSFVTDDPSAITQIVERLADRHGLTISRLSLQRQGAVPSGGGRRQRQPAKPVSAGPALLPVEVEVVGPFGRLARWLEALEAQAGLRVDEWAMAPVPDAAGQQRLSVTLSARLEGA